MSALSDFLAMGGYGFYVWGSYGVTFVFIAFEIVALQRRRKALFQRRARAEQAASQGYL